MDLKKKFNNEMTVWRVTGHTATGAPVVSLPELFRVRFSESNELIYTNSGEELYQRSLIISDEVFAEGDLVISGDKTLIADPVVAGASEIKRITKVPSLLAEYILFIYHV